MRAPAGATRAIGLRARTGPESAPWLRADRNIAGHAQLPIASADQGCTGARGDAGALGPVWGETHAVMLDVKHDSGTGHVLTGDAQIATYL